MLDSSIDVVPQLGYERAAASGDHTPGRRRFMDREEGGMRVLVNTLSIAGQRAGIGHYASELVAALRRLHGDDAVATFPGGLLRRAQAAWARARQGGAPGPAGLVGGLRQAVRGGLVGLARRCGRSLVRAAFRRAAAGGRFAVYHEPNYVPLECDLPTVANVHDLSAVLYPQWHPADRVAYFEKHFHAGLSRCDHLFAISEFGKGEIVRRLGWPAEKVTVTPMGVRPGLRRVEGRELSESLQRLGLHEGYLLHVGTLEPRKNVLMLMRAYCELPSEVRERRPLVLAGGKGWNSDDAHDFLQSEGRHRNVRWLGYVEDGLFAALYSGARALLFPTFYEGFGMPTIEMMACGGAVIASTAGAVAETAGGQAHLIDPNDQDAWRDAMLRACADDDWVRELARGAEEAARPFTWERCAELSWQAYQSLAASARLARRTA
jgi:alpha-1,3-rhamnosyl/mannosyltransferase